MFSLPIYDKSKPIPGVLQNGSSLHQTHRLSREEALEAQKQILLTAISDTLNYLQESYTKQLKSLFDQIALERSELEKWNAQRLNRRV